MDKNNTITPKQFKRITEDKLMFITFPGRMGDIYGCTIITRENKNLYVYRIDKLHEFKCNVYNQFPHLLEALRNQKALESNTFKGIYMGYGNVLFVNKDIYDDYKKHLDKMVEKEIKAQKKGNYYDESLKDYYPIMLCFTEWEKAVIDYAKKHAYILNSLERE